MAIIFSPQVGRGALTAGPVAIIAGWTMLIVVPMTRWLLTKIGVMQSKQSPPKSCELLLRPRIMIAQGALTLIIVASMVVIVAPYSNASILQIRDDRLPDIGEETRITADGDPDLSDLDAYSYSLTVRTTQRGRDTRHDSVLDRSTRTKWSVAKRVVGHLGLANIAAADGDIGHMKTHLERAEHEAGWQRLLGISSLHVLVLQEAATLHVLMAESVVNAQAKRDLLISARDYLSRWAEAYPANEAVAYYFRQMRATILFGMSDFNRAEEVWSDLIREIDDHERRVDELDLGSQRILGDALNNYAVLLIRRERFHEAHRHLERAIEIPAGEVNRTLVNLSWCLFKIGQRDLAASKIVDFARQEELFPAEHAFVAVVTSEPDKRLDHLGKALERELTSLSEVSKADINRLISRMNSHFIGLKFRPDDFDLSDQLVKPSGVKSDATPALAKGDVPLAGARER